MFKHPNWMIQVCKQVKNSIYVLNILFNKLIKHLKKWNSSFAILKWALNALLVERGVEFHFEDSNIKMENLNSIMRNIKSRLITLNPTWNHQKRSFKTWIGIDIVKWTWRIADLHSWHPSNSTFSNSTKPDLSKIGH